MKKCFSPGELLDDTFEQSGRVRIGSRGLARGLARLGLPSLDCRVAEAVGLRRRLISPLVVRIVVLLVVEEGEAASWNDNVRQQVRIVLLVALPLIVRT